MGAPAGQMKQLGARVHLVDLQSEQKDFADTAAIVANLDLVISIDTSVVHLAGAMGKPVWVLALTNPRIGAGFWTATTAPGTPRPACFANPLWGIGRTW